MQAAVLQDLADLVDHIVNQVVSEELTR